ncbi:cyclin-B1-1-like [Ananas comosus]|uniref:Cyclin-B1-1-like n=1 Tax=Ananas comosus TaxID=4615 RepID=A0A6P5H533_ANACO|nr:cyclin-B1-1-like [Ananas comosus]
MASKHHNAVAPQQPRGSRRSFAAKQLATAPTAATVAAVAKKKPVAVPAGGAVGKGGVKPANKKAPTVKPKPEIHAANKKAPTVRPKPEIHAANKKAPTVKPKPEIHAANKKAPTVKPKPKNVIEISDDKNEATKQVSSTTTTAAAAAVAANAGSRGKPSRKKVHTFTYLIAARSKDACGLTGKPKELVQDIDASDADDQLAVVDYVEDIYLFYKLAEVRIFSRITAFIRLYIFTLVSESLICDAA